MIRAVQAKTVATATMALNDPVVGNQVIDSYGVFQPSLSFSTPISAIPASAAAAPIAQLINNTNAYRSM